jgi:hypothetical protein
MLTRTTVPAQAAPTRAIPGQEALGSVLRHCASAGGHLNPLALSPSVHGYRTVLMSGRDHETLEGKMFTEQIWTNIEAQKRNREWIAALRSGSYRQGQGKLRTLNSESALSDTKDKFCCLGVACNLYDSSRWRFFSPDVVTYMHEAGILPNEVMNAYCLKDNDGGNGDDDHTTSLAARNDYGATFEQIADIIEKELNKALA